MAIDNPIYKFLWLLHMFPLKLAFRARILLDDKASASINHIITAPAGPITGCPCGSSWSAGALSSFTCLVGIKEVLGRPFLSEAGFEKVFRIQNWSVGANCFVDDFCCWGKRGVAAWTRWSYLLIISLRLVAWLFAAKRRPIAAFCSVRWLLEVFLVVRSLWVFAQVAGFHLDDCIE